MPEIQRVPYLVDPHVHFRTPGQEHKEDFYTGSCAALAGGVTTVLDMPNNSSLVIRKEDINQKIEESHFQAVCDMGFYLGTLGDERQKFHFEQCYDYVPGLKVYFNVSTGHYVVDNPVKRDWIFRNWESDKPILVHAEGETVKDAIKLAEKYDRSLYVCHVSTKGQVDRIKRAKDKRPNKVFAEVTPHHLTIDSMWSPDPYKQMKPPLVGLDDRKALWEGLVSGDIDIIATDHAPHTKEEKESSNPPSGVTGLETTLPILLMAERARYITLEKIIEVTHTNPLKIFGLEEQPETYVDVLRDSPWYIDGDALQTKCHTTPFQGVRVLDKVHRVTLRGNIVYESGKILAKPGSSKDLNYI